MDSGGVSVSFGNRVIEVEPIPKQKKDKVKSAKNGLQLADAPHGSVVNLLYNGVCGEFWSDSIFRVTKHRSTDGKVIAFNQRNERVFLHPTYKCRIVEE